MNYFVFTNIIFIICTNPRYPNIGYNKLTKFEKPILETSTEVMHINNAICV